MLTLMELVVIREILGDCLMTVVVFVLLVFVGTI